LMASPTMKIRAPISELKRTGKKFSVMVVFLVYLGSS
jgi:hypothetical protein